MRLGKIYQKYEVLCVAIFLAAFLALNVLTANLYPNLLCDEYIFTEPAVSFLHGQGFQVRFNEMLSMYSFLLVPWIKVFGLTLQAARSASYLCMTCALGVLWSAIKRLGLVQSASGRITVLFLLATEYGLIVSYRVARYDSFGVLLFSMLLWMMSIQRPAARNIALFTLCLFTPWAGLQYLPVIFVAGLVLLLLYPSGYWREVVSSFLGLTLGLPAFLGAVAISGRLANYWKFVRQQRRVVNLIHSVLSHSRVELQGIFPADYSLPFLLAAFALLLFHLRSSGLLNRRSVMSFVAIYIPTLSILLMLIAKLPSYYAYFLTIPCVIGILYGLSLCRRASVKRTVYVLCGSSVLIGVGLNLANFAFDWKNRDYGNVITFVDAAIHPSDVAYVDYTAYFRARAKAADVYCQAIDWSIFPMMSQQQKDSITVIIDRPEYVNDTVKGLGGAWRATGESLRPTQKSIFAGRGHGWLSLASYDLIVMRRDWPQTLIGQSHKPASAGRAGAAQFVRASPVGEHLD